MTATKAPERPTANIGRVLGGLAPLSFAVQVCSLASSIALARVLGAGAATDAYYLGLSIPFAVYGILMAAIRQGAIPALVEQDNEGPPGSLEASAGLLLSAVVVASAVLTVVVTAVAELVLPMAVGGETGSLARLVLLELAPLGVLGPLTGMLGATLAVRRLFGLAVLVMAIDPMVRVILLLTVGHSIGIQALIIGNLAGSAAACAVLWWRVNRLGLHLRISPGFNTPFVRGVVGLTIPLIVSASVLQANPVVDRAMAGDLGGGSVTGLELGLRLCYVPTALITSLLISPLSATWAERKLAGGWPALRQSVARAIVAVATLVPPLVVVGYLLRRYVVALVYQGGAYSSHALEQTTRVFGLILLALPGQVLVVALATLFVIEKDTVFPMLVGIANVLLNVALNFALRPYLGVGGIALSTTVTVLILATVYATVAHRRWRAFALGGRGLEILGAAVATAVVAGIAIGLLGLLPGGHSRLGALGAIAFVGGIALGLYGLVLFARRQSLLGSVRAAPMAGIEG